MTSKRGRSGGEEAQQHDSYATSFVSSCVNFKTNVEFHDLAGLKKLGPHTLVVGTCAEVKKLATTAPALKSLAIGDALEKDCCATNGSPFFPAHVSKDHTVSVGCVTTEASRHNCPQRPDVITDHVKQAFKSASGKCGLDVIVDGSSGEQVCLAAAIAKGCRSFSAKNGLAAKAFKDDGIGAVRVYFHAGVKNKTQLDAVALCTQLCMRLVDAPTNLLDSVTFAEIAEGYAKKLKLGFHMIQGEQLRQQGYGGVYGVGKAAEFPPALVTLTYNGGGGGKRGGAGGVPAVSGVSLVGKGIVYDTGGLAIKHPYSSMAGMKADMGGAAGVLAGFLSCVMTGSCSINMSCTLCLADNAIGPRSQRNDDIVLMKSGLSVEILNTDAEGRLVLGDGVYHAATQLKFTPDVIVDMATLTGAQGIATGKYHAAIFTDCVDWERSFCDKGRESGECCFPVLYCPEFHRAEFASPVADYKNSVKNRGNAQVSCAAQFVHANVPKGFKGSHVHVDMAAPATNDGCGTGYGVALVNHLFATL